jgi:hypothetical protein
MAARGEAAYGPPVAFLMRTPGQPQFVNETPAAKSQRRFSLVKALAMGAVSAAIRLSSGECRFNCSFATLPNWGERKSRE